MLKPISLVMAKKTPCLRDIMLFNRKNLQLNRERTQIRRKGSEHISQASSSLYCLQLRGPATTRLWLGSWSFAIQIRFEETLTKPWVSNGTRV